MPCLCKIVILSLFVVASAVQSELKPGSESESDGFSYSFPLSFHRFEANDTKSLFSSSLFSRAKRNPRARTTSYAFKTTFKYSMALIVSLPIGTPPQTQQMVLDTGSQLSWIQCHKVPPKRPPPTTSFNPSLSSTFSVLPCHNPICKPRVPDYTLPTSCDQNRLCHYSYFYADGTYAEGNLVREKFTFSKYQSTPPLTLGCAQDSTDDKGILGMNLGRLSFASQAKITKFSYCVPLRGPHHAATPTGSFYLGSNPSSRGFSYVQMMTFPQSQRMPNLDPLAYTLPLVGISIGRKRLAIPATAFRPSPSGAGQTMIDSGSEFTYLVDEAYDKVKQEVVRLVGQRLKKGYVYGGVADMCFDVKAVGIERSIGDMVFQFERGAQIVVPRERILADVGDGAKCVAIARSEVLGAASNIIGNFHQQNLWVEFDLTNLRVGLGKADCTRSH